MITKIFTDTLKNNGKYSRKNLTMFTSFAISILIAFIIIYGEWIGKSFDKTYSIFECFILMSGYNGLLTVADKKVKSPQQEQNNVN